MQSHNRFDLLFAHFIIADITSELKYCLFTEIMPCMFFYGCTFLDKFFISMYNTIFYCVIGFPMRKLKLVITVHDCLCTESKHASTKNASKSGS